MRFNGRSYRLLTLLPVLFLLARGPTALAGEPASSPATTAPTRIPQRLYLFSSFRGNGVDGLHLAWSSDGLRWNALNHDRSYLTPQVGSERLMRDPCIIQGADGEFHMVWTTGWRGRDIGYAHSKDLIHWSEQKSLPVMQSEPAATNCWAPELALDEANRQYYIFWASTIPGKFPGTDESGDHQLNHRIYFTVTSDFEKLAPPKIYFDPGFSVIDATMLQDKGKFYLIFKDETAHPQPMKHLQIAQSEKIEGPFSIISKPFSPDWVEGPTAIKIDRDYYVFFDMYRAHHMGAMRSTDLKTWTDVTDQISFPPGSRHGTVFQVSRDVAEALMR